MKKLLLAFIFLTSFTGFAEAQTSRNPCYTTGALTTQGIPNCIGVGTSTPLPSAGYVFNGITWDASQGILVGTAGAPSVDVLTVQTPGANGSFPTAATPIQGNASGTTGAVVGTLAGVVNKITYLCDFDISALGTANTVGPIVIAGLLGGSKTYQASTLAAGVEYYKSKNFTPCLPASAVNTPITITTTAAAGGTAVNVNSSGYQQ
jgi:hypothetical protein